jgi:hypothetical protein
VVYLYLDRFQNWLRGERAQQEEAEIRVAAE